MSRIKLSLILVFVIIVAIVGISIVIPEVIFSESYSEVQVEQGWTHVISNTPTQTTTASSTPTLQPRSVSAVSPTPTTSRNCVLPSVYWEEHPEAWLDLLVGNTIYSKDDIRTIFDLPSPEIYQILLQQLYISNLNIFSGADPKSIQDVLGEANQWLQEYSSDGQLSEERLSVGAQLAQTLAAFNTGLIGPGYCSPYEALIVTPLVILRPTSSPSPTAIATATATRFFVTLEPTAIPTKTENPDKKSEPTDPPRPTKEPDTPVPPQPTDPPPPTNPPPPPTVAPPEPTDPPKPTPTPAS